MPMRAANLFVPFSTTKPGGSGIGLVLSRQIAEAHGGSQPISSEVRFCNAGCAEHHRARVPRVEPWNTERAATFPRGLLLLWPAV
jgi:hypothetical protein